MNYTKEVLCGCQIKIVGELHTASIEYCPKHKAAPDMYEALKGIMVALENWDISKESTLRDIRIAYNLAKPALAKAEGRNNGS